MLYTTFDVDRRYLGYCPKRSTHFGREFLRIRSTGLFMFERTCHRLTVLQRHVEGGSRELFCRIETRSDERTLCLHDLHQHVFRRFPRRLFEGGRGPFGFQFPSMRAESGAVSVAVRRSQRRSIDDLISSLHQDHIGDFTHRMIREILFEVVFSGCHKHFRSFTL